MFDVCEVEPSRQVSENNLDVWPRGGKHMPDSSRMNGQRNGNPKCCWKVSRWEEGKKNRQKKYIKCEPKFLGNEVSPGDQEIQLYLWQKQAISPPTGWRSLVQLSEWWLHLLLCVCCFCSTKNVTAPRNCLRERNQWSWGLRPYPSSRQGAGRELRTGCVSDILLPCLSHLEHILSFLLSPVLTNRVHMFLLLMGKRLYFYFKGHLWKVWGTRLCSKTSNIGSNQR